MLDSIQGTFYGLINSSDHGLCDRSYRGIRNLDRFLLAFSSYDRRDGGRSRILCTFASELLSDPDISLREAQEMLGHANAATTAERYAAFIPRADLAKRMEKAFGDKSPRTRYWVTNWVTPLTCNV